ncbi:MAG: TrkA family potassium uptake protein [Actinomycetota bacterium]
MAERSPRQWTFGHRQPATRAQAGESVVVLGLGRFGGAVAAELLRLGYDVLGVDHSEAAVQYYTSRVSHAVQADITSTQVLRQLGVNDMTHAIVAVGTDLEASILATAALDELGLPNIWAKAVSRQHGRILERVGAHHVVYPEHDMGHQVAHMIGGRILDWFQLDEQFALVETVVPSKLVGRTLAESGIREKYNVTVVCVKPAGGKFTYATVDTKLQRGDILVVAGETAAAEAFARLG